MGDLSLFSLIPLPKSKSQIFTGEIYRKEKKKKQVKKSVALSIPKPGQFMSCSTAQKGERKKKEKKKERQHKMLLYPTDSSKICSEMQCMFVLLRCLMSPRVQRETHPVTMLTEDVLWL